MSFAHLARPLRLGLHRHGPRQQQAVKLATLKLGQGIKIQLLSASSGNTAGNGDETGNNLPRTSSGDQLYLHIAPCGDCWTGREIFAAKHLQPDYVRSVPVPEGFDPDEHLTTGDGEDDMETEIELLRRIYDEGKLPADVIRRFHLINEEASNRQRDR
uniref:Uncharacterized protein n=1 Tax=Trieres chinensis TaxID=1514140 RepID=A0A7S2A2B9_TRICV